MPIQRFLKGEPGCRIECVDLLDFAIEKLREYGERYQVSRNIEGIVMPLEEYEIGADRYHLIMAVSALEHIDGERSFVNKLREIRDGVKGGGFVCLVINSEITEVNRKTGERLEPQFEVNLPTDKMKNLLNDIFAGWKVVKFKVTSQRYDVPRENCIADLKTNVVTLVAQKEVNYVFDKIQVS